MAVNRLEIPDHGVQRQVEPMRQEVNQLSDMEITRGRLLAGVEVTTNRVNRIRHGLGRRLVGYIVVANALTGTTVNIRDNQLTNPSPETELWLDPQSAASETKKISLWVF